MPISTQVLTRHIKQPDTCSAICRTEYRELRTHGFVRGKKDPAKMTHAITALVERGLGTRKITVSDDDGTGVHACGQR